MLELNGKELEAFQRGIPRWLRLGIAEVSIYPYKGKWILRIQTFGEKPLAEGEIWEFSTEGTITCPFCKEIVRNG